MVGKGFDMTNFEKIKNMTSDELADAIIRYVDNKCVFCNHFLDRDCSQKDRCCQEEIKNWLESEI